MAEFNNNCMAVFDMLLYFHTYCSTLYDNNSSALTLFIFFFFFFIHMFVISVSRTNMPACRWPAFDELIHSSAECVYSTLYKRAYRLFIDTNSKSECGGRCDHTQKYEAGYVLIVNCWMSIEQQMFDNETKKIEIHKLKIDNFVCVRRINIYWEVCGVYRTHKHTSMAMAE